MNVDNLAEVLVPAYNSYCDEMPGVNCHFGCSDEKILMIGSDKRYSLYLQDFSHKGRVVYCTDAVIKDEKMCLFNANGK